MEATLFLYFFITFICTVTTVFIPKQIYEKNTYTFKYDFKYFSYSFIPIIIYTLFWGLRDQVGADYQGYADMFYTIEYDNERIEPIYLYLNILLRESGFSHISIFLITSYISIWSLFYIAKYESKNFSIFVIFFFFTTSIVLFYQNGIRQSIAFSFLIMLISCINKEHIIKILVLGLIAWGFHKSVLVPCVILMLLYYIPQIKLNKYIIIIVFIFTTFWGHHLYDYIFSKFSFMFNLLGYTGYEDNIDNFEKNIEFSSGLGRLLKLIINCIIIFYQEIFFSPKEKKAMYFFYIFFLLGILLEPIVMENGIMKRLNIYFINTRFIIYAYFCTQLLKSPKATNQILMILLILAHIMLFSAAILSNSNSCVPYKSIFS